MSFGIFDSSHPANDLEWLHATYGRVIAMPEAEECSAQDTAFLEDGVLG